MARKPIVSRFAVLLILLAQDRKDKKRIAYFQGKSNSKNRGMLLILKKDRPPEKPTVVHPKI